MSGQWTKRSLEFAGAAAMFVFILAVFVAFLAAPTLIIYLWIGLSGAAALIIDIVATMLLVGLVVLVAVLAD